MSVNAWLSVRDDFDMGNTDPEAGPISRNAEILLRQSHDWDVVGRFYPNENAGRSWQLWSIYYPTLAELDAALAELASLNPGRTKVLAAWRADGSAYLPPEGYAVYGNLERYMPMSGDPPMPDPTLRDINLLAGQPPRVFT